VIYLSTIVKFRVDRVTATKLDIVRSHFRQLSISEIGRRALNSYLDAMIRKHNLGG